eukprot:m.355280 g.355280  ORF g.355280 m.355280 type:complete len:124 (+) comp17210_c0_seq1:270-641(+)
MFRRLLTTSVQQARTVSRVAAQRPLVATAFSVQRCGYAAAAAAPTEQEMTQHVISLLSRYDGFTDPSLLTADSKFQDLGLDSLDVVECVIALEDEFAVQITDDVAVTITTPKEAAAAILKLLP